MRNRLAASALLKRWFPWSGGATPGNAGGGCGEGVGDAVTEMSSSAGERGAVVRRPTCVGDDFGEVVLCAVLQLIDMGPREVELGSVKSSGYD